MAKNLVLTAGGRSVILPIKPLIVVEVAVGVTVMSIGTAIGAVFGHPFIGFLSGFGVVAVSEVAEFFIAKSAIKSGKLSISVQ